MSDLTWTIGSALASALLVLGIAASIGALGAAWLLRSEAAGNWSRTPLGIGALGAGLAIAAAVLRALLQSAALADEPSAWAAMIEPVLFETEIGLALRIQAASAFLVLVALLGAKRWGGLWFSLATLAACVLALAPGLGGHPAAHEQRGIALSVSFVHAAGVGLWLGTLAVLTRVARSLNDADLAVALRRFHRIAAIGLAAVVVTGVAKLVDIQPPIDGLTTSVWGVALLAKLTAFAAVAFLGWRHWRNADATLAAGSRVSMLRSFGVELAVAALVLIATSVLINSAPPEPSEAAQPARVDAIATRMYREIASPYCPGMSLAACPSEGAFRLKSRIRERLASVSRDDVMAELVAEFGPEISGRTPAKEMGLLAWIGPFAAVLIGLLSLTFWLRRSTRRAVASRAPSVVLSVEQADLDRLHAALRVED